MRADGQGGHKCGWGSTDEERDRQTRARLTGVTTQVGELPDQYIDPDADPDWHDWRVEHPVAGQTLDVRDTTFDDNWPCMYSSASRAASRACGAPEACAPGIAGTLGVLQQAR